MPALAALAAPGVSEWERRVGVLPGELAARGVPEWERRAGVPGELAAPGVPEWERRAGVPAELAAPAAWEQAVSAVDGPAELDGPVRERPPGVLPAELAALNAGERFVSAAAELAEWGEPEPPRPRGEVPGALVARGAPERFVSPAELCWIVGREPERAGPVRAARPVESLQQAVETPGLCTEWQADAKLLAPPAELDHLKQIAHDL